jgi:tRNA-2-methylthio-N6-dimethylallyladenosine synthase
MFAFNAIPGTKAAELPDQLPVGVKNERLNRLIKLQNEISCSVNEEMVGQTFEILVEGRSPKDNTKATGLTRQAKTMNFTTEKDFTGQMVAVKAIEGHLYGYVGEIL